MKTQLPALETVDEKDLPGEFWSVSGYQRPRKHLNGIKADDLKTKYQQMGIKRGSPSSRPTSPIAEEEHYDDRPVIPDTIKRLSKFNETMFDEVHDTRFDPDDGVRTLEPAKQVVRYPKRFSSLNAINELLQQAEPKPRPSETFYESNSSNSSGETEIRSLSPNATTNPPPERTTASAAACEESQNSAQEDIPYRSKQPLPPLPAGKPAEKDSKSPLISKTASPTSNISLAIPVQHPSSPKSKGSSRSSQSARKSLTFSSLSDVRNSTAVSDATWEDDVDFCYEQAAESTCYFDWDAGSQPHETELRRESSTGAPVSPYHSYSPAVSNDSGGSLQRNGASSETIAERRRSRAAVSAGHHKRGSSVGHRGFLMARKSSTDLVAMADPTPAPVQVAQKAPHLSVLSPVFSVTAADDEPQKSPFVPGTLHYPNFDGVNPECLSDPESYRDSGSTRHRKSDSYGSRESAAKTVPNPARDPNRWSAASASSLPELYKSRPKSQLFLTKTIISQPLESLPQSPPAEQDFPAEESTIVPRELQTQPVRNSFVMRRPQTPGDRAVLQAAGRMVQQRGARPGTPARLSRIVQTPDGAAVPEAAVTGPAWI